MVRKITIPDFITHFKISEKRRAKYFKEEDVLPKKYSHLKEYDSKGRLLDETGTPVIKNSRTAGKPRLQKINGQAIYSGMNPHLRSKMMDQMHEFFNGHIDKLDPVTEFPICVALTFSDSSGETLPDVDNQSWIYVKAILDCMQHSGIIPNDSPEYVSCYSVQMDKESDTRMMTIEIK